jgi:hypothetical protein
MRQQVGRNEKEKGVWRGIEEKLLFIPSILFLSI